MWEFVAPLVLMGYDISSTQATGFHSSNNYVVFGEHWAVSDVAVRHAGVLNAVSKSSGYGPGQVRVVI